jgi:subtilisin family serine protease
MRILIALLVILVTVVCVDYQILFKEQVDFDNIRHPFTNQALSSLSFEEKGQVVYHALKTTADLTQRYIRELLDKRGCKYKSFWIYNTIFLHDPDEELLEILRKRDEVKYVKKLSDFKVPLEKGYKYHGTSLGPQWNVQMVKAPEVWKMGYNGTGIVVGVLDSGVNVYHNDLKEKYRGYSNGKFDHNYNWYDAATPPLCKESPCDTDGHGSHVTGTILGSNEVEQIGVAPGAKFIACRAFVMGSGSPFSITSCLQWFLAPTNLDGKYPNYAKRPHILSNSWGATVDIGDHAHAIASLKNSGVISVFAAGNSGPQCGTILYPGRKEFVFTVGALAYKNMTLANFSSRGPASGFLNYKPNVVAPGEKILSCDKDGNNYVVMSGTSMSAPAVSGAVALLWSAKPNLIGKVEKTMRLLEKTADPIHSRECESSSSHPNSLYGYGLINPLEAIKKAENE